MSIDLAQRCRDAAMWWPARGEDVALKAFAEAGSGTTVLLELKTTEARGPEHSLRIDVDQLLRYREATLPVFYVFPLPFWHGSVAPGREPWLLPDEVSVAGPLPEAWWQHTSTGSRWFDSWLFVLPAEEVRGLLAGARTGTRRLLAIDLAEDDPTTFARNHEPVLIPWPDFWRGLADGTARGMRWVSRRTDGRWSVQAVGAPASPLGRGTLADVFEATTPASASATVFVRLPA